MYDPKFTPEQMKAMNDAYNQAMQGKDKPVVGSIQCPACERTFTLVIGQENQVCEHIHAELNMLGPNSKLEKQ